MGRKLAVFCMLLIIITMPAFAKAKETEIIKLTEEKPTGLQAMTYEAYRQKILNIPSVVEDLHKHSMQISDLWDANKFAQIKGITLWTYPHLIWVSRSRQRLVYFEYGIPKRINPVSTGKYGDNFGLFVIDYKDKDHVSHGIPQCEGVKMPYSLHFTAKGIYSRRFIHGSKKRYCIGKYPDSLGCVRQYNEDASDLFNQVDTGVHVLFTA